MTARIAEALGWRQAEVELIRRASPLHDVGKIAIPDSILLKPGKLTPEEFERMKTHTSLGAQMLSGGKFPLLQLAEQIALTHHERWDGTGYIGLHKEAIPMAGRIVTVADVFDALTSKRPYKEAWTATSAIEEIQRQRGQQFDPDVVDAFLTVIR
jgi:putative two-component system response regulator